MVMFDDLRCYTMYTVTYIKTEKIVTTHCLGWSGLNFEMLVYVQGSLS